MNKPHDNETCRIPFCKECLADIRRIAAMGRKQLGKVPKPTLQPEGKE